MPISLPQEAEGRRTTSSRSDRLCNETLFQNENAGGDVMSGRKESLHVVGGNVNQCN